jgi:Ca-activated chloride channel family protein
VVVLSDGMTEQRDRPALVAALAGQPAGTRLFAVGVGNEVDRPLLEQLTAEAGGMAAFLSRGDDLERQAAAFYRKLTRPAASGVEILFEGGGVYDLEPKRLPDLFHGAPLRLYGRYRKSGPVSVVVRAEVDGQPVERRTTLELPAEGANPEIERMWAWHRVDRLLKEADAGGGRSAAVDEVVRLGEAFSIVTEHTSFLVLENDAEYQRWKIERRNAGRLERERRQQQRRRQELEALRQRARRDLGPGALGDRSDKDAPAETPEGTGAPSSRAPRQSRQRPQPAAGQPGDLDLGGGAVGPAGTLAALALAGGAWAGRPRRRRRQRRGGRR